MLEMLLPDWLVQWCKKLADSLVPVVKFFGKVFNPMIGVVLAAYELLVWVSGRFMGLKQDGNRLYESYADFKAWVGNAAFSPFPAPVHSAAAFMNTFIPITEALILMGLLAALYVLASIVRVIKACIPTVAS